ncbi:hypothetical protein [Bifidobacterium moukalabense]|uniref:hypothetical protein n=1 Tax=Bifidobacterium moukalabense TaxID=1333651 RepID=UPI0010F4821E|nr:hypothetical protein [Bifidobacterium moukalabense]
MAKISFRFGVDNYRNLVLCCCQQAKRKKSQVKRNQSKMLVVENDTPKGEPLENEKHATIESKQQRTRKRRSL